MVVAGGLVGRDALLGRRDEITLLALVSVRNARVMTAVTLHVPFVDGLEVAKLATDRRHGVIAAMAVDAVAQVVQVVALIAFENLNRFVGALDVLDHSQLVGRLEIAEFARSDASAFGERLVRGEWGRFAVVRRNRTPVNGALVANELLRMLRGVNAQIALMNCQRFVMNAAPMLQIHSRILRREPTIEAHVIALSVRLRSRFCVLVMHCLIFARDCISG